MARFDRDSAHRQEQVDIELFDKVRERYAEFVNQVQQVEGEEGVQRVAGHDLYNAVSMINSLLELKGMATEPIRTWNKRLESSGVGMEIQPQNLMNGYPMPDQKENPGGQAKFAVSVRQILEALAASYYFLLTGSRPWYDYLSHLEIPLLAVNTIATVEDVNKGAAWLGGIETVIVWNLIHNAYKAAVRAETSNLEDIRSLVEVVADQGKIKVVNLSVSALPETLMSGGSQLVGDSTRGSKLQSR